MRRARVLALVLLSCGPSAFAQEAAYKVIVNASNPVTVMRREQVAVLFMNRKVTWSHGPTGQPVDQSMTAPVREAFSNGILGQSLLAVQNYWRKRMLEEHEFPPSVKTSDEEVIAAVAKSSGGIGYVAPTAALPPTVKEVKIPDAIH